MNLVSPRPRHVFLFFWHLSSFSCQPQSSRIYRGEEAEIQTLNSFHASHLPEIESFALANANQTSPLLCRFMLCKGKTSSEVLSFSELPVFKHRLELRLILILILESYLLNIFRASPLASHTTFSTAIASFELENASSPHLNVPKRDVMKRTEIMSQTVGFG